MPEAATTVLFVLLAALSWVGHAFLWTTVLNYLYARPFPKPLLKIWRLGTGLGILAFPFAIAWLVPLEFPSREYPGNWCATGYGLLCLFLGGLIYPALNLRRLLKKPAPCVLSEKCETIDFWKELGPQAIGNGHGSFAARLPFNCVYRVDFTDLILGVESLPAEWEGLTILHITDVHFHGTPSEAFFEHVFAEANRRWPVNDLVCLTGDYVDTDEHVSWIAPMLGRFTGREGNFAILGNHDAKHDPERVRRELAAAGYRVLGNSWCEAAIRGVKCQIVGHEGPWFSPSPNLDAKADGLFRIGLSHTPDHFYWAQANRIGLMLCGHVHGGQIRLPFIGSMFVPSIYGRRFDMGVFQQKGAVMVVSRGLSGKEPLRIRCHPQVIRITLQPMPGPGGVPERS